MSLDQFSLPQSRRSPVTQRPASLRGDNSHSSPTAFYHSAMVLKYGISIALSWAACAGSSAAPCAPTLLSEAEAKQLVMLVPVAQSISQSGGTLIAEPCCKPSEPFYTFMVTTDLVKATLLENGLVGYFSVNKITGQVFDVADVESVGPQLRVLQQRLRAKHCVSEAVLDQNKDKTPQ